MPHVLTRARAVVGSGILAVLLLACYGTLVFALAACGHAVPVARRARIDRASRDYGPPRGCRPRRRDRLLLGNPVASGAGEHGGRVP